MSNYYFTKDELYHHGIKGQKWGIRRTKEELNRDPISREIAYKKLIGKGVRTKDGVLVKKVSEHVYNDIRPERIQTPSQVLDAIKHPIYIGPIVYNKDQMPSKIYVGKKAVAAVNPNNGIITTVFPTTPKRLRQAYRKSMKKGGK